MSLVLNILKILWETEMNYKGVRVNMFGIPTAFKNKNKNSYYSTLSRLKRNGYVIRDANGWYITSRGKEYVQKQKEALTNFEFSFKENAPKDLLIIFDIPETLKSYREWFRKHLKKFGYEMIQRSVWVGPSPIPHDFKLYLKSIGLDKNMKTFKLSKSYITK